MPEHQKQSITLAATKLRATQDALKKAGEEEAAAHAASDMAKKQEEKKRAGFVTFMISGAGGLVSRCSLPIKMVVERGLFRIRILLENTKVIIETDDAGISIINITNQTSKLSVTSAGVLDMSNSASGGDVSIIAQTASDNTVTWGGSTNPGGT